MDGLYLCGIYMSELYQILPVRNQARTQFWQLREDKHPLFKESPALRDSGFSTDLLHLDGNYLSCFSYL